MIIRPGMNSLRQFRLKGMFCKLLLIDLFVSYISLISVAILVAIVISFNTKWPQIIKMTPEMNSSWQNKLQRMYLRVTVSWFIQKVHFANFCGGHLDFLPQSTSNHKTNLRYEFPISKSLKKDLLQVTVMDLSNSEFCSTRRPYWQPSWILKISSGCELDTRKFFFVFLSGFQKSQKCFPVDNTEFHEKLGLCHRTNGCDV